MTKKRKNMLTFIGESKSKFLKNALVVALGFVVTIGCVGGFAPTAQGSETTVVGKNNPDIDVDAVQTAVDNFDIVNLLGTFHFGDETIPYTGSSAIDGRGNVTIIRNGVTVTGNSQATIYGGYNSLTIKAKDVTIQVLCFNSFRFSGVLIFECGGVTTIKNNLFINGQSGQWGGTKLTFGICSSGILGSPPEGELIYENNVIALFGDNPSVPQGLVAALYIGNTEYVLRVTIRGNTICAMPIMSGIYQTHGISLSYTPNAIVTIEKNIVEDSQYGVVIYNATVNISKNELYAFRRCIFLNTCSDSTIVNNSLIKTPPLPDTPWWNGAIGLDYCETCEVSGNTISGIGNSAIHLWYTNNCLFKSNNITMDRDSFSGFYIFSDSGYNEIQGNKLGGIMGFPFYLDYNHSDGRKYEAAHDNTILGNNIVTLSALEYPNPMGDDPPYLPGANVYLGQGAVINNDVRGYSGGSVIDEADYFTPMRVFFLESRQYRDYMNTYGDAGYENGNLAEPYYYHQDDLVGPYVAYYNDGTGWIFTEQLYLPRTEPMDGLIPYQDGDVVLRLKNNFVTGFEPMVGAGGIGHQGSSVEAATRNPTAEEIQAFEEWLEQNPEYQEPDLTF